MKYTEIVSAEFIERPTRFNAYVDLMGARTKVHVKNTGRCRELLTDHARVYLEKSGNAARATAYDLVVVEKEGRLVNMDSNAPNKVAGGWLRGGGVYGGGTLGRAGGGAYIQPAPAAERGGEEVSGGVVA